MAESKGPLVFRGRVLAAARAGAGDSAPAIASHSRSDVVATAPNSVPHVVPLNRAVTRTGL